MGRILRELPPAVQLKVFRRANFRIGIMLHNISLIFFVLFRGQFAFKRNCGESRQ